MNNQTFTFRFNGKTFQCQAVVSGEAMVRANREFLDGQNAPMGVWQEVNGERNTYTWVEGDFFN